MKNLKLYIILIILLIASDNYAQHTSYCHNDFSAINKQKYLEKIKSHRLKHGHDEYVVRLFVHIMRRDDGTAGITEDEALDAIRILQDAFNPLNNSSVGIATNQGTNNSPAGNLFSDNMDYLISNIENQGGL